MPGISHEDPHERRQTAESFGSDAQRYDRARPRYPEGLVRRILEGAPGKDVIDVGCGTGIAARQFEALGGRVLGVEPDERMAEVARQLGIEVDVSTFEEWDPRSRQFDVLAAAQAWHWIDSTSGAVKAAEVLRPGGLLAVFWNAFQFPPEVADAFLEVFQNVMPQAPIDPRAMLHEATEGYQVLFGKAAAGIRASGQFADPEQWRFDWTWTYTRETWLDQMPTLGTFTRLPAPVLDKLLEGVGLAVDALGGNFAMRYATVAVTALRSSLATG